MKLANLATAAVFAAFLAAPIGSLALFGPHKMAEKTVTTAELISSKFVTPDDNHRNDVSRRLVTNSPVGMDAISAKNSLDFRVFGFVNTTDVISGEDGWLFYKPGFQNGACLSDRDIGIGLARIEAMRVLAEAVGIDFRVSVSPDKEVVYPERLGPAAEAAAGCKIYSSRRWREIARASGSSLIDHLEALNHTYTDDLFYFQTDTHWNELGRFLSVSQIAELYLGTDILPPRDSEGVITKFTDITTNLLRIPYKEAYKTYSKYIESEFDKISTRKLSPALIVHDSFYGSAKPLLGYIFNNPTFLSFIEPKFIPKVRAAIEKKPQYILVNSVERVLFRRLLESGSLWGMSVGKAIFDANSEIARNCPVSEITEGKVILKNITRGSNMELVSENDPQMYIELSPIGRPCIHFYFETQVRQKTVVYLPLKDDFIDHGTYAEGFSIPLTNVPGPREFSLLLPEEFAGTTLRIDPIAAEGHLSKLRIQSGYLPSTKTAAVR